MFAVELLPIEDDYYIKPSSRKNKKYDIYKDGSYVVSFGDTRYEQYEDKTPWGLYSDQDHKDLKRLSLFWKRHKATYNKKSANYWNRYLW